MQIPQQTTKRAEVMFCAIDRIGAQAFLAVCTTVDWRVYRLDKFSATRESLTPVQITVDEDRDGALLSNVRMLRLFCLPPTRLSSADLSKNLGPQLGGFFVLERCEEANYSHTSPRDDATTTSSTTDYSEDLAVFSFTDERILKRLPPTPSSVIDLQIQRSTAAVLCESHEILLVDLVRLEMKQRISSLASLAVALGPRWIAYPGSSRTSIDDESESDEGEMIIPEALLHGGSRRLLSGSQSRNTSTLCASTPPSYNATDVAQNLASGIYFLGKTIAPYLSTSPSTPSAHDTFPHNQQNGQDQQDHPHNHQQVPTTHRQQNQQILPTNTHAGGGHVVVQDLLTNRVVAHFHCHATALVHLSFDFSGSLLATSSTKGQNVHVYRLLPPLQSTSTAASTSPRHQLLYKLQRGITHASIADMAFSQDAKWLNVTTAHGTSHLYAIHPDGTSMSLRTHATVVADEEDDGRSTEWELTPRGGSRSRGSGSGMGMAARDRDVSDFCADFRAIEPKTLSRVLKIHHTLHQSQQPQVSDGASSFGLSALSASSAAYYYSSPPTAATAHTIMNTALDASQALFSQLAQSTGIDFSSGVVDDAHDLESRRRRRRRRLSCLFASDGLKMVIYCDGTLKLYDLSVHAPIDMGNSRRGRLGSLVGSSSLSMTKTRPSPFGFDATVAELRVWDLLDTLRIRSESASGTSESSLSCGGELPARPRSTGIRTFVQRGLPLWAHPKASFRVVDVDHPEGLLLQVKRKGPSNLELGGDGLVHGGDDQQLFVMEMDSYFGLGGSPVFTGQSDQRVAPEAPPRLDLAESMNLAISTSIKTPPSLPPQRSEGVATLLPTTSTTKTQTKKKTKTNGKHKVGSDDGYGSLSSSPGVISDSSDSSSTSTSVSSSPTILQFTLQDMYFGLPPPASE